MPTAHLDTFARDNLPPAEQQPDFVFTLPELQFPAQLNCATALLDRHIEEGRGDRLCIRCLLYTSPSPRDYAASRMPSSA